MARCCRCANGFPRIAAKRSVILALHGFNDYSTAFEGPGEIWSKEGLPPCLRSARLWRGTRAWVLAVARWGPTPRPAQVLRRSTRECRFISRRAWGGAVAVIAMTGESGTPVPDVDGVILTAPAVWGRPTMGLLPTLALWAGVRLMPGLNLSGRGLEIKPSDNIAMLRALAHDPLVIHETRIDTIYGLVDLMDATLASAPLLDAPMLVAYGAKDEIVPKASVRRFVDALPPEPQRRRRLAWYDDGYHMLLRDLQGSVVAADVASWALAPRAPLPSGADRRAEEAFARGASQASAGAR
jgi:pimeloyl-ACP methyl ester carboxylesterase